MPLLISPRGAREAEEKQTESKEERKNDSTSEEKKFSVDKNT